MIPKINHPVAALLVGAAAVAAPAAASAAALERAVPAFVRIFYEDGMYGEIGLEYVDPDQSGKGVNLTPLGQLAILQGDTGDVLESHWNVTGAFKGDINARWSYLVLLDQPFGVDTQYGRGTFANPAFSYYGTQADLNTYQLSGAVAYDVTANVKVYAGLRAERVDATAAIPFLQDYSINADNDWGYGFLVGAAYARPEIGLRVALSYLSTIKHDLDTQEFSSVTGDINDTTKVDTPQSVTLEGQTGINSKTLLFGSVRWVDWSEFAIEPPVYALITQGPLVDYESDWWTYNFGVARSFTETLAGSLSVTYEPQVNDVLTTLGPVDGRTTIGAGLSYDIGQANVAGGVTYGWLGDTTTVLDTKFRDGDVFGAGLRVSYSF